jgi:hypothetical protein
VAGCTDGPAGYGVTLYLTPPSSKASPTRDAIAQGKLGMIDTPYQQNRVHELHELGAAWCADNGCFSSRWRAEHWWAFLERLAPYAGSCLFATAPDVVADAAATLVKSLPWMPRMRALGYKVAFVAQNGIENIEVPWDEFDALFLGGSSECVPCSYTHPIDAPHPGRGRYASCPTCGDRLTEWKIGPVALEVAREAKRRGKWLHMGRVNSAKRYRIARDVFHCDSVDGTKITYGPTVNLARVMSWPGLPVIQTTGE